MLGKGFRTAPVLNEISIYVCWYVWGVRGVWDVWGVCMRVRVYFDVGGWCVYVCICVCSCASG